MEHVSSATTLAVGTGLSANVDPLLAAEQACEQACAGVATGQVDLALVFASGAHVEDLETILAHVRATLEPGTLVAVSAEGVIGGEVELERQSGLSIFAASLPGTSIQAFLYRDLPHVRDDDPGALAEAARIVGARRDLRGILFFADPFSVPAASAVQTLSSLRGAVEGLKRCPVVGGMASGSAKPGGNVLALNDQIMRAGGIGVTIRGAIDLDTVVSQGCRPIGRPHVVTSAQRNIIKTLGGERAVNVLRDTIAALEPEERELIQGGVFIGRVIDEYKSRFGRGDFLIRGVLGVDQSAGAVAVGDVVRAGQTIQFHLRDSRTAAEDLELLLSVQQLQHPPAGGLLMTCNGRGTRLFSEPHRDARTISRALGHDEEHPMPLAGLFAAGEIGPIGDSSFLHGHTASLVLLRPRRRVHDAE